MPDLFDSLPTGTRVVVRYRLPLPHAAGPSVSDALGELLAVEYVDGVRRVRIRTRRGEVSIPTLAITHAKPVPPPRPRRGGAATDH